MRLKGITIAGLILLMFAIIISPVHAQADNATNDTTAGDTIAAGGKEEQLVDDIEPDDGIGPDNVLYKLKLTFEDLDVAFTFNESEKIGKQVSQARHRLAEIKSALKKKNSRAADIAIEQYEEETKQAEESISKIKTKDKGLVRAQARIANHSYVLERLMESNPNNTGLARAYNNSEELLEKFTSKTSIKFERRTDRMGRKVIRHVEVDDEESGDYEKTSVKASVEDNRTHVKVELKFITNSTDEAGIAADILDRIDAVQSNLSDVIKIEREDEAEDSQGEDDEADEPEVTVTGGPTATLTSSRDSARSAPSGDKMKAEAEVRGNTTRVKFEYRFFLNTTEDAAIISGVQDKLSGLTADGILASLDVKVKEDKKEIEDQEDGKISDRGRKQDEKSQDKSRDSKKIEEEDER